jgi:hypothetical protein
MANRDVVGFDTDHLSGKLDLSKIETITNAACERGEVNEAEIRANSKRLGQSCLP